MAKFFQSLVLFAASFAVLLPLAGCGNGNSRGIPKGEVTGSVTHDGQPVTEGVVHFLSQETGIAGGAELNSEGRFALAGGIEIGKYRISVTPPAIEGDGLGSTAPVKEYKNIPEKYRSHETSGLEKEIVKGKNDFTIPLE